MILDEMDFKGQELAERLYQIIIVIASIAGFAHGYMEQSFSITFKYWLVGSVLAFILTVPSWPWLFNRHPVKWLQTVHDTVPPISSTTSSTTTTTMKSNNNIPAAAATTAVNSATKKKQ